MPVGKKQSTPNEGRPSTEQPVYPWPDQAEFLRHLKALVQGATRIVMEKAMLEEIAVVVGAKWGEHTPDRKGYRNGFYSRDLGTTTGPIEGLKVPRDREGQYQTQLFDNYRRYEPQVEQGLVEMFVKGASTTKVGEVAQTLLGVAPSASAVSRMNADLTRQFEDWRSRDLAGEWLAIWLDGVYFQIRHGEGAASMPILVALAVDKTGHKEVLALRGSAEESKEGWHLLLSDLKKRGVQQVGVFVTDGNDGLLAALAEVFPATPRQRCWLHVQRSVTSAVPRGERNRFWEELSGIWKQPTLEAAQTVLAAFKARYEKTYPEAVRSLVGAEDHLFTFYQFDPKWHKFLRTTNAIESLFSNVRGRTDSIKVFTTEESCLAIVWATISGIKLAQLPV
jgi:putative transposase